MVKLRIKLQNSIQHYTIQRQSYTQAHYYQQPTTTITSAKCKYCERAKRRCELWCAEGGMVVWRRIHYTIPYLHSKCWSLYFKPTRTTSNYSNRCLGFRFKKQIAITFFFIHFPPACLLHPCGHHHLHTISRYCRHYIYMHVLIYAECVFVCVCVLHYLHTFSIFHRCYFRSDAFALQTTTTDIIQKTVNFLTLTLIFLYLSCPFAFTFALSFPAPTHSLDCAVSIQLRYFYILSWLPLLAK